MIVWIASYPRSGNTFLRIILNSVFNIKTYSIYNDRFDIAANQKISEIVGHIPLPDTFDIQKARKEQKTYYIKTHELLDDRVHESDKVIYLIRDGRDCTLSFVKHQNAVVENRQITNMSIIAGNVGVDGWNWGWGDHVASWQPNKRKNTLQIRFETLIKEPLLMVDKIADFLDKEPSSLTIPTFDKLHAINPVFFRSGKENGWKNNFSEEEHIAFWEKNSHQMKEYGYTNEMPKENGVR